MLVEFLTAEFLYQSQVNSYTMDQKIVVLICQFRL